MGHDAYAIAAGEYVRAAELAEVSEETGEITGFDDVFSKLEKARDWYEECGLGKEYADQFIR